MSLARFGINGTPSAPPPAGFVYLYMKADKLLYFMDDTGTELPIKPVGGGTGDLLSDGTVPLTANWNAGAFKIIAAQLESNIVTGTAPFIVASTTLVTNLNAEMVGGTNLAGIQALIDAAVVGLYDHKGAYDASTNTPDLDTAPSGILKGDAYTVSAAGTFFALTVEAGDVLIADQDAPTLSTHWTIVNRNIDSSAFATAAQGATADTALQPADITALLSQTNDNTTNIAAPIHTLHVQTVANQDYVLTFDAPFAGTITTLRAKTENGTCTVTGYINAVALGGTANSASSTATEQAHASANVYAKGDEIKVTVTANSAALDLEVTFYGTRTDL